MRESYSSCDCSSVNPGPPVRPAGAIEVQIVPGSLPDKAHVFIGSGVMQVGADFWDTLDNLQQYGVVAHERAHEELPQENCESCIDMRAGAIMRHEGISREGVRHALAGIVSSRDAAKYAVEGWDQADAAIRDGTVQQGKRSLDMQIRHLAPGESGEDPELEQSIGEVDNSGAPSSGPAPRKGGAAPPPSSSAPPKAPSLPPAAMAIIGAVAVAIIAGLLVQALTKGKA